MKTGKFAALFGEPGTGETIFLRIVDKIILFSKTFSPMLVAAN
jgi:ABC-type Na+ transport system ATPase subunit NatA